MDWKERLEVLKEAPEEELTEETVAGLRATVDNYCCWSAEKEVIVETRASLRYMTLLLTPEETRAQRQERLSLTLKDRLLQILLLEQGDNKVRVLAARLVSNLVTNNMKTARIFLLEIPLSPSSSQVAEKILATTLTSSQDEACDDSVASTEVTSWVDLLLSSSQHRPALGALVAALYNAMTVLLSFETKIAVDSLLISTLLRHMLPSLLKQEADEATEWISLFFGRICRCGHFELVYQSIGTTVLTPEHVVFLHCISGAVEEWLDSTEQEEHPLGKTTGETLEFMSRQANALREEDTAEDHELTESARTCLLDMIAHSLSTESCSRTSKTTLGPLLVPEAAQDLVVLMDSLQLDDNKKMRGSRDIKLTPKQQERITVLVRLLGNLCYNCRSNQDLMANPIVGEAERTVLHVLLTCTSLSIACFTLREWTIVALRHVLHEHEGNQHLVAGLQAQEPMQSANLDRMGLKVEMETNGKVKVVSKEGDSL